MKSALEGIDNADMDAGWKPNSRAILENNIAFMEDCLAKGVISMDALQAFAKKQVPFLKLDDQLGGLRPRSSTGWR